MINSIRSDFEAHAPKELVNQLFETYHEIKRNFFLGNLRPNEVEGGRFSEAVFRILEHVTTGKYTKLGVQISQFSEKCSKMENLPAASFSDSIRIHIPRTIRLIYDIRNKRDVAHLADGIDPNIQDATFVVCASDWVMSEFVREFHKVTADEAYALIKKLVAQKVPAIEEFGGVLKTLNPSLSVSERILILLYHRGDDGASIDELKKWLKPEHISNLPRTLNTLEREKDCIICISGMYKITKRGIKIVEDKNLMQMD